MCIAQFLASLGGIPSLVQLTLSFHMQKVGLILFKFVYLGAGVLAAGALIDACNPALTAALFSWIYLSTLHFAARLIYKFVATRKTPISFKNEWASYFWANIYWLLTWVNIKGC